MFHGVDRVVFLMEVLVENLFSSIFQLLEVACILWLMAPSSTSKAAI